MPERPNILLIMNDDMGYSDIGCYGGEIHTPNLDLLAANGLRFTQFYNTARCCPTRASLLTGLHPHQASVGHMMDDREYEGYRGDLNFKSVTIAEVLKTVGYATYMSGKWHITRHTDADGPKHSWPCQRGFDRFFGIITGAANYWKPQTLTRDNEQITVDEFPEDFFLTDAISDQAADYIREHAQTNGDQPFFLYTAYTAPHWPLHAHDEDIAKYKDRFAAGWDQLREERLARMREMGILKPGWGLSDRDSSQVPWEEADHKAWQQRRMEVYAAQVDRMDQGIGRIVQSLEETGQLDNTLIVFLADNGGCAEELGGGMRRSAIAPATTRNGRPVQRGNDPNIMPGDETTYQSYGVPWANVSNTPFRLYKHWVHEGGIATPFIVHWPAHVTDHGTLREQPGQLTDVMATCLDIAGAEYPETYNGHEILPLEGASLTPIFDNQDNGKEYLIWEHEGNGAVRKGKWKLVKRYPGDWELYDIEADRSELGDLANDNPDVVSELSAIYDAWAERCGIEPWDNILAKRG
ncbi:MAG: arylsulfatase [Gemmatimonadetes bacterium]|nr:arylsulfatase [Gemmatimonadota bacterium]MYF73529.1 arylsulfatase [Gemmatimonadota bacterium]MYK52717.1 arylsulfatase [Gemmatimonadota bacterium]